jgi:hypothetical protein
MSSISHNTAIHLTCAVSILNKELEHDRCITIPGNARSVAHAVNYCYLMAKNQLAQTPLTDEKVENILNEYVWCYIVEMGPIHLAWFGPSTRINEACARVRTLMTFMQDRLNNHTMSSPDAHNLVQCVDAILKAYDAKETDEDDTDDDRQYV